MFSQEQIVARVAAAYSEKTITDVYNDSIRVAKKLKKELLKAGVVTHFSPQRQNKAVLRCFIDMHRFLERRGEISAVLSTYDDPTLVAFMIKSITKMHPFHFSDRENNFRFLSERQQEILFCVNETYAIEYAQTILKTKFSPDFYRDVLSELMRGKFSASQFRIIFFLLVGIYRDDEK